MHESVYELLQTNTYIIVFYKFLKFIYKMSTYAADCTNENDSSDIIKDKLYPFSFIALLIVLLRVTFSGKTNSL